VVGGLATWRLTHMLVAEDGPWDLFLRLRMWAGAEADMTDDGIVVEGRGPLTCQLCTSVYVAVLVLALWYAGVGWLVVTLLALSGVASLIALWEGSWPVQTQ